MAPLQITNYKLQITSSPNPSRKKWRRTPKNRYPDGRSFVPTRASGCPGPIRGGRPMRHALRTAVLALAVLTLGTAPARAVDQAKIDKAIDRGVAALKALQARDGTWPHETIGATALAAL